MSRSHAVGPWRRIGAGSCIAAAVWLGQPGRAEAQVQPDPRSGTVRIYISLATSAVTRLVKELAAPFPNLKVEFVRAGSIETIKRFTAERQAGRIATDLIHGADPGGFEYFGERQWLDPALADPALLKDFRDGFHDRSDGWVAMRATGIALMYNTKAVRKDELPKTWKELIEPKWKGRVAISDPNRAGSSFSHLYAMWKIYGADYIRAFAKNDVLVAGDGTATREAVANGERDIAPVSEYDAFQFKAQGKPVDVVWVEDGTILLPAPLAVVKGSQNAENAKALGAYLLSKAGQELIAASSLSWSARKDVKAPPGKPELDAIKTVSFDWTKAASEKSTILDLYFQAFQNR